MQSHRIADSEISQTAADIVLYAARDSLPDMDVHFRVLLAKIDQRRRQHPMRNRHEASDDELTTHLAVECSHLLRLLRYFAQQPLRHRDEFPPGFCLRDVPRTAREQLCAQMSLGLLNDAAQAGLRYPQIRRSRVEAAESR